MRHFLIVTFVAIVTIAIVLALYRPDLLEDAWLWIIGLIGPIIGFFRALIEKLKATFNQTANSSIHQKQAE